MVSLLFRDDEQWQGDILTTITTTTLSIVHRYPTHHAIILELQVLHTLILGILLNYSIRTLIGMGG